MKKKTVARWIYQQRNLARSKEKSEVLRSAKLAALEQCETWLYALTWARMRAPVRQTCEALRQKGHPLVQKGTQISETEAARLAVAQASNAVYTVSSDAFIPFP